MWKTLDDMPRSRWTHAGFALLISWALAAPAAAGALVVTPAIFTLAGQSARCDVVNASAKSPLTMILTLRDDDSIVAGPTVTFELAPLESTFILVSGGGARHCVADVVKGSRKNVRLSLSVRDSSSTLLATVAGN